MLECCLEEGGLKIQQKVGEKLHDEEVRGVLSFEHEKSLFIVSGGFDKSVQIHRVNESGPMSLMVKVIAPKKVTQLVRDAECNVIFSDKFGDIYKIDTLALLASGETEVNLQEDYYEFKESQPKLARYVQGNLSTMTSMTMARQQGRPLLVVGDEYNRIKVFDYPAVHRIEQIYQPFQDYHVASVETVGSNTTVIKFYHPEQHKYRVQLIDGILSEFRATDLAESGIETAKQCEIIALGGGRFML